MSRENPYFAKVWAGEEEEYEDDGVKLFCDDASIDDIEKGLQEYPSASELYFAHRFSPNVVRHFENKIAITLEVKSLRDVPKDLQGNVNVVLRVPDWVDKTKVRRSGWITMIDMIDGNVDNTKWDGRKAYPEDEVVVWEN